MSRLLRFIRHVPIWKLIFAFALLRGIEKTVEAWFIRRDTWLLVDAWCPAIAAFLIALGLLRYRTYPFWVRALTGLGAISYAALSFFTWKSRLPSLKNPPVEFLVVLVVSGLWGIALVYLAQGLLRLRSRRRSLRAQPSISAS